MHQRRLGKTQLQVSEVALGALEIGAAYGIGQDRGQVPDEDAAVELLRAAADAGITLFDTAGIYGLSEARIGKYLKNGGERPVLTSKLQVVKEDGQYLDYATRRPFDSAAACVDHQVRRSLHNLGIDTLDVMQLHGVPEDDDLFNEMTQALERHVQAGRLRFIGASCGGSQIPRLAEAGYSTAQLAYNVLDQHEREEGFKLAQEHDLGVLIRIPLALGVLAGRVEKLDEQRQQRFRPFLEEFESRLPEGMSMPEAALRFVVSSPEVSAALVGTRNPDHARSSAKAGDGRGLPDDLVRWLHERSDAGEMPEWSWAEHNKKDWPAGADEVNLELCRSVDID